jgi:hypothetical protein
LHPGILKQIFNDPVKRRKQHSVTSPNRHHHPDEKKLTGNKQDNAKRDKNSINKRGQCVDKKPPRFARSRRRRLRTFDPEQVTLAKIADIAVAALAEVWYFEEVINSAFSGVGLIFRRRFRAPAIV